MKSCDAHCFVTGLSLKANTIGAMYVQIVHTYLQIPVMSEVGDRKEGEVGGGKGSDW
jgi:hypothetical protein